MSELPTGTVTFLFTDIEGSTRLLHELGAEGYAEALAEHRRVIREACAVHDGAEVDTQVRTVSLQRRALSVLASLARPIDSRRLVFPSPEGGIVNLSNLRQRVWRPALAAAGCDYRPVKEMRHTYACLSLAAGAPIEWISSQMGHSDIRTTLRYYARFLPPTHERALALLDGFGVAEDQVGRKVDAILGG